MEANRPSAEEPPKLLATFTALLRSTKLGLLNSLALRIEASAARLTSKRRVAVLLAVVAFVVAAKSIVTATNDTVSYLGKTFLDWGVCHELSPTANGFGLTEFKRTCHPKELTAFKWKYASDKDACSGCDNRAFVMSHSELSGRPIWVELYLKKPGAAGEMDWGSAHNWIVVDPRINRRSGSFSEGLLLRRQDQPALVQDGRITLLEAFVPLRAGIGCQKREDIPCLAQENTLFFAG